jgi:hypothetical protein
LISTIFFEFEGLTHLSAPYGWRRKFRRGETEIAGGTMRANESVER